MSLGLLVEVQLHSIFTFVPTEALQPNNVHVSLTLLARSSILPVAPEVSSEPPAASTSFCKVWGSGLRSRAPESNSQLSCSLPPPDAAPITNNRRRFFFNWFLNLAPLSRFIYALQDWFCFRHYATK